MFGVSLKNFARARSGSVLPTFAIAFIPLLIAMGGVVDYTNAFDQKELVQDAMDSAALAAGKKIGLLTMTELQNDVDSYYTSNIGDGLADPPPLDTSVNASTITLTTELHVPTYFLGMIGIHELVFPLTSQATLALGTLEVAMVLDNSTSMTLPSSKIATLKTAAGELATTLWGLGATSTQPDPVKIAIVPFGAAVNVGPNVTWIDKLGKGTYAADAMKGEGAPSSTNPWDLLAGLKDSSGNAITWAGCVEERPDPYNVTDDPPSTAVNPTAEEAKTLFEPMFAPDEPDNWTCSTYSCDYAGSTTSTRRFNGAPSGRQSYNNYLPDAGEGGTCPTGNIPISSVNQYQDTLTTSYAHNLSAGDQITFATTGSLPGGLYGGTTYYVLSSGLTSTTLKVSTYNNGYAVNITSSGYGSHSVVQGSDDWTCSNGNADCGGTGIGRSEQNALGGVNVASSALCKYGTSSNKATVANIQVANLNGTGGGGPNFMCTTQALTPLTTSQSSVTSAINSMQANGYTNITDGLMWGWRAISPGEPFTEGRAYTATDNQKIIVLMTDGENTYHPYLQADIDPGSNTYAGKFVKSAYGAWAYLFKNHLGTTSTQSQTVFNELNSHTATACANAKAAGITIYTVGFEINDTTSSDPETTKALLQNCATDTSKYFDAQNETDLLDAFHAIGDQITLLRISQ